nr:MAG TPA: hypothetical protein [Caudoviricetes sp.]
MFSFNSLKAILYVVYSLGANSQKHLSYHKNDHLLESSIAYLAAVPPGRGLSL